MAEEIFTIIPGQLVFKPEEKLILISDDLTNRDVYIHFKEAYLNSRKICQWYFPVKVVNGRTEPTHDYRMERLEQ